MPRVSVLIPIHNRADLLKTSLKTALAQHFTDLEVLVAGDGVVDNSEQVALESGDPRVRWFGFPKAPGFGYANRARALAHAQGELVAYLSPDDLWAPDHLEHLVAALADQHLDFVFSRPIMAEPTGQLRPHYFAFDVLSGGPNPPVGPRLYFLSGTQVVHTRTLLERSGGWDSGMTRFGDVDLWLRCRSVGARMRYLPRPTVLRLPELYFRGLPDQIRRELHAELGRKLLSGQLELSNVRWPPNRRVTNWLRDFVRVGRLKGPAFARTWLARGRRPLI